MGNRRIRELDGQRKSVVLPRHATGPFKNPCPIQASRAVEPRRAVSNRARIGSQYNYGERRGAYRKRFRDAAPYRRIALPRACGGGCGLKWWSRAIFVTG